MGDEEIRPQVTREQVERYKELQKVMTEFRKTLGPRKTAIFETVVGTIDVTEVMELIEVSGGESLSVTGEVEGQKLTVMFRIKE